MTLEAEVVGVAARRRPRHSPTAEVVRTADPEQALLEFWQTSYEAADHVGWDRRTFEGLPARRATAR